MLHIIESKRSVEEIEKMFPEVAAKHKFGVLEVHNLRQIMNQKGIPFEKDCLVFEVCDPNQAKKVLEKNLSISTALPCRISVFVEKGQTKIATIKPTALLELFHDPSLKAVAEEVERAIFQMMKELS